MTEMGPDMMKPDERAAGVISGSDPYRELELYLEKVNEEFGEVFERWLGCSEKTKMNTVPRSVGGSKGIPLTSAQRPSEPNLPCNGGGSGGGNETTEELTANMKTRSLPTKTSSKAETKIRKVNNTSRIFMFAAEKAKAIEREWSENLMADFEKLIEKELNELKVDAVNGKGLYKGAAKKCKKSPDNPAENQSNGVEKRNSKSYKRSLSDGPDLIRKKENESEMLVKMSSLSEDEMFSVCRCSDSELPPRRPRRCSSPEKSSFIRASPFGRNSKGEKIEEAEKGRNSYRNESRIPPPLPVKRKKKGTRDENEKIPVGLQSFLTKLRPQGSRNSSPMRDESPGEMTSSGFNTMDSSIGETDEPFFQAVSATVSVATQTSPALSRSSSFTWMSDCSSSIILNTPGSFSDANDDDKSSTSSDDSSSSPPMISEDCLTSESKDSSPESTDCSRSNYEIEGRNNSSVKCSRKETWERIRRRNSDHFRSGRSLKAKYSDADIWIRRESVHTQTQEKSETDEKDPEAETDFGRYEDLDRFESRLCGLPPLPKNDPTTETETAGSLPLRYEKSRNVRPQNLAVPGYPSPCDYSEQLPSPSTASLKSIATPISTDLGNKSSSAPVIMKKVSSPGKDSTKLEENAKKMVLKQPRSQSERHLAEIEAAEACKWLRAAGFPQYAQMYEDLQFPIDVSGVQKDHPFLDKDSLQSLYRRLHALNRCAKMKIDNPPKNSMEDSDEDEQCALSENWTFQQESRRWSRVCDVTVHHSDRIHNTGSGHDSEEKGDSMDSDRLMSSKEDLFPKDDPPVIENLRYGSLPQGAISADSELIAVRFRRTGSERLRDSAKAILRRMESLKSRRRKKQHRENVVISGPQVLDVLSMQQKMKDLNCVDVSPTATSGSSPEHSSPLHPCQTSAETTCQFLSPPFADDSSSYCSDNSQGTPVHRRTKSKLTRARKFFHHGRKSEESGALSDSEIHPTSWKQRYLKDANSNNTKVVEYVDGNSGDLKEEGHAGSSRTCTRGGSLNLGKESQRYREKVQANFKRKDGTTYINKSASSELTEDSSSTLASQPESDPDPSDVNAARQKATVVRWHSFQRGTSRPESYCGSGDSVGCRAMSGLSSGQLLVLRKLALLKLTACMEKYCPTHRTGWNWELPKFIRKIKAPDYKDKTVFGVPLLLSLQRSGQALPKCIQVAMKWLRTNALDQVGLFRKSGVRSRIQTLKAMTENQGETISYDGHQAYDVADMVKQYFRELPEALLTNKLSETFISIFQHVPVSLRGEAVQWVLLLLPDEHREALQAILEFLNQVSARSTSNQMTSSNLAVCLAPSLFHLHHPSSGTQPRSTSASPRRRKTVGVPDQRELGENKAAHDCLLYLMKEHRNVFTVSEEMFNSCRFSSMDYSIPMTVEQLGSELPNGWRDYLRESTTSFLREAKEKSRGWINVQCSVDQYTEMAYKKVRDGHPLRLWKVWTDVEAPPQELVRRVLRERHVWDSSLLKWRVVARLDAEAEIFQFVCGSMPPLPVKDYCVLRSWRTDLPKGACVVVETSVEHPDAPVMLGGVRGVVLASRYLIEPCGSGKSRIVHLSRVDTKGRSPEWYNKSYGYICAMQLSRIRTSFKHNADGPESKV